MSMRISYNNLVTESNLSIVVGGAAAVAPFNLGNLCNGKLQPEARFTGATSIMLRVDFGSPKRIEVARFRSHDFPGTATIDLRANDIDDNVNGLNGYWIFDKNEKGGVVRPGLAEAHDGYRFWFFRVDGLVDTTTYRLGELQFTDADGDIVLPVSCIESSAEKVMLHKEKVAETEGGQFWSYSNGDIIQYPGLRWQYLNPAQTKTFEDLHLACRGRKSFWLCLDDTNELEETSFMTYLNESLKVRPSGPGSNDLEISCQEVAEGVYK